MLKVKYLVGKKVSSITFNCYYRVISFDMLYKWESIKVTKALGLVACNQRSLILKGRKEMGSWLKFYLVFLRNCIGFPTIFFDNFSARLDRYYRVNSYNFFLFLDFLRFFLVPQLLSNNRFVRLEFSSYNSRNGFCNLKFTEDLSSGRSMFEPFYDFKLKFFYFGSFLKERALYLDTIKYSCTGDIYFFFDCLTLSFFRSFINIFSFLGFKMQAFHDFYSERGAAFRFSIKFL